MNSKIIILVIFILLIIGILFYLYKDQILGDTKAESKKPKIKRKKGQCTTDFNCGDNHIIKAITDFPEFCENQNCDIDECCDTKGTCIESNCTGNKILNPDLLSNSCVGAVCETNTNECCILKGQCTTDFNCGNNHIIKATTDFPEFCENQNCDIDECCDTKGQCTIDFNCGDNHIIKATTDFPEFCNTKTCDIDECCDPKGQCTIDFNCGSGILKANTAFPELCSAKTCTIDECCVKPIHYWVATPAAFNTSILIDTIGGNNATYTGSQLQYVNDKGVLLEEGKYFNLDKTIIFRDGVGNNDFTLFAGFSLNSQVGLYKWLSLFGSSNNFDFKILTDASSNITYFSLRLEQLTNRSDSSFNINNQICIIYLTLQNTTLTGYVNGRQFDQRIMNFAPWNNNKKIMFNGLLKGNQYFTKNERILSFAGIYDRALTHQEVIIASQNH